MILLIYHFREEIHIPELSLNPNPNQGQNVSCIFVTTVDNKSLRIGFAIPASNKSQREKLIQIIPKIQHELLLSANDRDLIALYEKRDFDALKTHLLTIVNAQIPQPVETLYFESFYYN